MYVLIKQYQFTTSDSVIITLDKGLKLSITEGEYYIVPLKKKEYRIPKDIVEKNPDFFEKIDFKTQLVEFLKKQNKNSPYVKKAENIEQFFNKEFIKDRELVPYETVKIMLEACIELYKKTNSEKWLEPISDLGWDIDNNTGKLFKI